MDMAAVVVFNLVASLVGFGFVVGYFVGKRN